MTEFIINNGVLEKASTKETIINIPDSVTSIGDEAFGLCENLTITARRGSYAEKYAIKYGIKLNIEE